MNHGVTHEAPSNSLGGVSYSEEQQSEYAQAARTPPRVPPTAYLVAKKMNAVPGTRTDAM